MFAHEFRWDKFFQIYWRERPLVVRGGARFITDASFDRNWLLCCTRIVEAIEPASVARGGNGVIFVQNIDRADASLASVAAELGKSHGFYRPWFDAVLTEKGSSGGIGCHYDDSDNFVLQQKGRKLWRVHSPESIPITEQRARMMKVAGIGNAEMAEATLEVLLEEGDLLYLPLLWPHLGQAAEDSLSVSLVCNSTNASRTMARTASMALSASSEGWRALPRARNRAEAEEMFDHCWETLTSDKMRAQMRALWLRELVPFESTNPEKE